MIKEANEQVRAEGRTELPNYEYPDYVVTATRVAQFSRYGVEFSLPADECQHIRQLDAQAEYGKAIFGSGFLLSERMKAEKEKAEKEKAEKEKAEKEIVMRWALSDREMAIVQSLAR